MHKAFAARNKVESVRKRSRSGGAFAAFSEYFIDKLEGAVYGAVLDDEYKGVHMRAADHQTKEKMCGAKYVQSEITGVLAEIVDDLREGKKVLFAGTPCQVAAVKAIVPKDKTNSILFIDIVCHSVPSPKIFAKFIEQYSDDIESFEFRNKSKYGWRENISVIKRKNCSISTLAYNNIFYNLSNMRPSCYCCPYKSLNRPGDITIGDCWGVERVAPELDDNMGVSLVLINTEKGEEFWTKCEYQFHSSEIDIYKCLQHALVKPLPKPQNREAFWNDFEVMNIKDFVKKYGKMNLKKKLRIIASRAKMLIARNGR